jgi:hypothetical protein
MRPTASDRLNFQRALADTRLVSRLIWAVVPQLVKTPGFDADTQSAGDVSVGLGQEAEAFVRYQLYANVRNVDQALKTFGAAPPGAEVGDTYLTISRRDRPVLDQVKQNDAAYLVVDGDRFRPTSVSAAGVGQVEEWVVMLQRFTPPFPAPGL